MIFSVEWRMKHLRIWARDEGHMRQTTVLGLASNVKPTYDEVIQQIRKLLENPHEWTKGQYF